MKLALILLFTTLTAAQSPRPHTEASALPDAPLAQQSEPLRLHPLTWHQTFTGKMFITDHTAWLLAALGDAEVTHEGIAHHLCHEGNPELPNFPSRGDLYRYNLGFWGGFTVVDLLLRKAGVPWAPYIAPMIGGYKNIRGASSWGKCW